jgi:hypothetical protein
MDQPFNHQDRTNIRFFTPRKNTQYPKHFPPNYPRTPSTKLPSISIKTTIIPLSPDQFSLLKTKHNIEAEPIEARGENYHNREPKPLINPSPKNKSNEIFYTNLLLTTTNNSATDHSYPLS